MIDHRNDMEQVYRSSIERKFERHFASKNRTNQVISQSNAKNMQVGGPHEEGSDLIFRAVNVAEFV